MPLPYKKTPEQLGLKLGQKFIITNSIHLSTTSGNLNNGDIVILIGNIKNLVFSLKLIETGHSGQAYSHALSLIESKSKLFIQSLC